MKTREFVDVHKSAKAADLGQRSTERKTSVLGTEKKGRKWWEERNCKQS